MIDKIKKIEFTKAIIYSVLLIIVIYVVKEIGFNIGMRL